MMDPRGVLLCLLLLGAAAALHEPCPRHCRCTAAPSIHRHHRYHRLLARFRMQRLVHGYKHAGRNMRINRPEEDRPDGREMTCLGLKRMPSYVPTDVTKLTFYGDKRGSIYQQDQAPAGYYSDEAYGQPAQASDLRLTQISRHSFSRANALKELTIEGNKLKVVHPRELELLRNLRRLHMKNNNIKVLMPGALNGLGQLEELDVSNNKIRRVSRTIFHDTPQLKKLYMQENKIKKLSKKVFRKLKDLQHIDLSNNKLLDLHKDIFYGMLGLREITLDDNALSRIKPEWFYYTNNLQKLSVKGNELAQISIESFNGLQSLRTLYLHKNKITSVPKDTFSTFRSLERLDLSHNAIKTLDVGAFKGLSKLHTLSIAHNNIADVQNGTLEGMYSLVDLSLAGNKLYQIRQSVFRALRRVQRLDLSHNRIKILRYRNFFGMIDLRELKLDHNDLRYIEDEAFAVSSVHTFSKITWLYLNQNKLSTIQAKTLQGLHYLKFINLGTNKVYDIHENAFTLTKRLSTLLLYNNKIGYLKHGQFKHLNFLHHLSLADNEIRDVPFNAFKGLRKVEDINLEGNEISTLSPESFLDTPHLMSLNLKENDLKQVDLKLLDASQRLRYLDLAKNRISHVAMPTMYEGSLLFLSLYDNYLTTIPENIVRTLRYGGSLHLYGNPWACDCKLAWLQRYAGSPELRLADEEDIVCKSPAALAGEQILSLEPDDMTCGPVKDVPQTSPLTCDFMDGVHDDNTRTSIKSQKDDLFDWVATFYDSDHRIVCSGALIAGNTVLTHSHCWKKELDLSRINVTFGQAHGSERDDIRLDRVLYYPGGLDIALVKVRTPADRFRKFPCLLSESGVRESQQEGAFGILPVRVNWDRPRARVKLNGFPLRALRHNQCANNAMCLRGKIRTLRKGSYVTDGQPYFVKVGRSKWALGGVTQDRDMQGELRVVRPIYPAVNWIQTLV